MKDQKNCNKLGIKKGGGRFYSHIPIRYWEKRTLYVYVGIDFISKDYHSNIFKSSVYFYTYALKWKNHCYQWF